MENRYDLIEKINTDGPFFDRDGGYYFSTFDNLSSQVGCMLYLCENTREAFNYIYSGGGYVIAVVPKEEFGQENIDGEMRKTLDKDVFFNYYVKQIVENPELSNHLPTILFDERPDIMHRVIDQLNEQKLSSQNGLSKNLKKTLKQHHKFSFCNLFNRKKKNKDREK